MNRSVLAYKEVSCDVISQERRTQRRQLPPEKRLPRPKRVASKLRHLIFDFLFLLFIFIVYFILFYFLSFIRQRSGCGVSQGSQV